MNTEQLVTILLKAEDQASDALKNSERLSKKFGDSAQQANQKAEQASQRLSQSNLNTNKTFTDLNSKLNQVKNGGQQLITVSGAAGAKLMETGTKGSESFKNMSKSEQDALIKFNMLDAGTRNLLSNLDKVNGGMPGLSGAISDAKSKFDALNGVTNTWGGSLDYARSKVELMGTSTDSLKGKLQVVGTGIQTYVGNKWDTIKSKVSSFGGFIKSNLSGALQTVRSKIDELGSAFNGLGGIISSAIGMVGMSSISEMTIGLSMNRERMTSLTNAVMGGEKAGDRFLNGLMKINGEWVPYKEGVEGATVAFKGLDAITNESLVSMDDLGQSLSTIKMSTGMSNKELEKITPLVNDIGQRAILMGKSGEEAVSLMQAAGKGLNGEFNMLQDNFGITKKKLEELGWSGAADDVEGYIKAMDEYLEKGGSMDEMMDTTTGHLETLKGKFRVAGRHIGDMFTPYIDQAVVGLIDLQDKCPGVFEGLVSIAGAVSMFATLAPSITPVLSAFDQISGKAKSVAQFLGIMKAEEDALTLSTLRETLAQNMSTVAKAAGASAAAAETAANEGLAASFFLMSKAILTNPLTWLVVALIAVAIAIYKVGQSFGWWKDIPSMLSAIWSGIQRLWNAFINHPDVQSFISGLKDAWNNLKTTLLPVMDWLSGIWNKICPPDAEGKFDIVHSIIVSIGNAWNTLKGAVGWVVGVFKGIWNAFNTVMNIIGPFGSALLFLGGPVGATVAILRTVICILLGCSPGIVPALRKVEEVFSTVWSNIVSFLSGVITTVVNALRPVIDILTLIGEFIIGQFRESWNAFVSIINVVWSSVEQVVNIFSLFLSGQISLSTMLGMIWNTINTMFASVLMIIINRVHSFGTSLINLAIQAGLGFLVKIILYISKLPRQVYTYLLLVYNRIKTQTTLWVNKSKAAANQLVMGVINYIKQLPGKVHTQLANVLAKIISMGAQWVSSAKSKASEIVIGVVGKLKGLASKISSVLSGVKNAIVKPFKDAWSLVKPIADKIKSVTDFLPGGYGGEIMAAGGEQDIPTTPTVKNSVLDVNTKDYFDKYTGEIINQVNVDGELDLNININGLPDNISEETILELFKEFFNDKSFKDGLIREIALSSLFQKLDNNEKTRLLKKLQRSKGV